MACIFNLVNTRPYLRNVTILNDVVKGYLFYSYRNCVLIS